MTQRVWGVLAGLLDGSPEEAHRHIFHVSNTLCAAYVTGDLPVARAAFPAIPNKEFDIRITAKRVDRGGPPAA